MTITPADRESYQSNVEDFYPQIQPDGCYPTAIKNIIDELSQRKDLGISLSLSDINDLCGYREGMYTQEEIVPEALSHELRDFGYQAVEESAPEMDREQLDAIIQNDDTSLPIVELDGQYFDQIDQYRTQGRDESSHTVIVFKINSDRLLYYDPFESFFEKSSNIDDAPTELDRTVFYELWSGDHTERWTFWLERREQSLATAFGGSQ